MRCANSTSPKCALKPPSANPDIPSQPMRFLPLFILISLSPGLAAQQPPRNETTVVLDEAGVANLGIETTEASETDLERSFFVLGAIDHTCESHSVLSSRVAGRIIEVAIHQGEFVTAGELIARLESRQPGNPPPVIELRAPADGLVVRSDVHLGAPVEPEATLLEIQDLSKVWVVAKVPQHQAAVLDEGLVAKIRVPAVGQEELVAEFLRIAPRSADSGSAVEAIFELPNPGIKLRPGMRAELELVASRRENVLTVPRAALQGDRSNRFLFIKDYELENAFVRVPVTLGEVSGDRVEVIAGLFPGDEVVTRGAYELTFAGKGNASLKEALDAAHGHPHKEDGSEMSAEDLAAAAGDDANGHSHDHGWWNPLTLVLAVTCGVLFLLLIASPLAFRNRAQA
jgi:membrane fusion protein, heavy metal efflux system